MVKPQISLIARSAKAFAIASLFAVMTLSHSASAQLSLECGSLDNAYGPYDYSNATHRRERLRIVELNHFDGGVERLRGHARKPNQLAGDIDYTLRAFPNHHKALFTMIKYHQSENPRHRARMRYSPDCYFQRAITFQPNDGKVRLLYGIYKAKTDSFEEAKEKFKEAEQLMPGSAEVYYNIGLMLAKNGETDEAYDYAVKAYDLGYPLPGLKNILSRAGKWPSSAN